MNREAERHLVKAEGFLAKGAEFYRKAAAEIVAAKDADPELSNRAIARRLERAESWVRAIVKWDGALDERIGPFSEAAGKPNRDLSGARKLLREAPLEQVEQIITELPRDRQQAIAAAAGNRYARFRQDFDEEQRRPRTEAEQREHDRAADAVNRHVARVAAPFQSLSIEAHLEQATELLNSMVEDGGVTAPVLTIIEKALDAFITEFQVARGVAGLDSYERSDVV